LKKPIAALAAVALTGGIVALAAAPAQAATIPSTDTTPTWVNYDTRAAGHYEYVDGGLHVWTDFDVTGSPDPRKVSLATQADYPLAATGALAIDYTNNNAAAFAFGPGLNLFVDFDGNGSPDGTLVYEAVYGQDLWLTGGSQAFVKDEAPVVGGGNGSDWHGTIDQWVGEFPDAEVVGLAFALGSGVNADGVIHSISAFGNVYTFDLAETVTPVFKTSIVKSDWTADCTGKKEFSRITWEIEYRSIDGGLTWTEIERTQVDFEKKSFPAARFKTLCV
jgi:hypothetical protein